MTDSTKKLVLIESPFAGDILANITYARACVSDSVHRGEAPIASHLLFTQEGILDDSIPGERRLGIEAGWAWYRCAQICAVYVDNGISPGMVGGILEAKAWHVFIDYRSIRGLSLGEIANIVADAGGV